MCHLLQMLSWVEVPRFPHPSVTLIKIPSPGTSLAVQWLRLRASSAGGAGSIPGQGTRIPHAAWRGKKKKKISSPREEVQLEQFGSQVRLEAEWPLGTNEAHTRETAAPKNTGQIAFPKLLWFRV